jgi:hypothetical protein
MPLTASLTILISRAGEARAACNDRSNFKIAAVAALESKPGAES